MKALILAAGYAVRLYPLTKQYPKPLLKVDNRAIIDYIIDKIECLYYFPKSKLKLIKEYLDSKKNKSDATGFYIDWLSRNYSVYGFVFKEQWYDIGDKSFLNKAKQSFANKL